MVAVRVIKQIIYYLNQRAQTKKAVAFTTALREGLKTR
jgi:hypothetical protein